MKSLRVAVSLFATATVGSASLSSAAVAASPEAFPPPVGATRLVSTGFLIDEVFLRNADVSNGAQYGIFAADSAGGPSNIEGRRPDMPVSETISRGDDGEPGLTETEDAAVAPDSSFVVYASDAPNIGPGNRYFTSQIYLFDTNAETTTLISSKKRDDLKSGDSLTPSVSPDSKFIVYESNARHLAPGGNIGLGLYVYEVATGITTAVDPGPDRVQATSPVISSGGRYVAFATDAELVPEDVNDGADVYRYDRTTHRTALVSRGSGAESFDAAQSFAPQISADGNRICYTSSATNLVPGDPGTFEDIYLADATARTTQLISRARNGGWPNGDSASCDISADGQVIVFSSEGSNLVPEDYNRTADVFSTDTASGVTQLLSRSPQGVPGDGPSTEPAISADGDYVVYQSYADDLAQPDPDFSADIFITRLR